MEVMLEIPEAVLVHQDDLPENEDKKFYLIAKGRCEVEVADQFKERQENKIVRVMGPGDHFGEITMLFDCKRSATVKAKDYCTCGYLEYGSYTELVQSY
jgi:CRP-like cAMP-binding protein